KSSCITFPRHWRVIEDQDIAGVLHKQYDIVFFLNWACLPEFDKGSKCKLVYDFFSPSMVEHAFIASRDELQQRRERKLALLEMADLFIANGVGRQQYAREFIKQNKLRCDQVPVLSVPLSLEWSGRDATHQLPTTLFFGGFSQAWITGLKYKDLLAISHQTGTRIVIIGHGQTTHSEFCPIDSHNTMLDRRLPSDIVEYDIVPYETFSSLNAASHIGLDVFEENNERQLSYSTRAVTSLSCGCPIITMDFTEIGQMVNKLDAGWTLSSFSVDNLIKIIQEIQSDPSVIEIKRRNTKLFWKTCCHPVKNVQPLVTALKEL
ncbi:MAG: hypothetical protein D3908_00915, partial [Candidatus Electrothrix sp. AUS4]|nr:hypothetical protein [Candidatus Electrothrix sp. AUS4]